MGLFRYTNVAKKKNVFCTSILLRLTKQRCNTIRDSVGYTERQQQDADDWGSQPSHDEIEVNVSNPVCIHLKKKKRNIQVWLTVIFVLNNNYPNKIDNIIYCDGIMGRHAVFPHLLRSFNWQWLLREEWLTCSMTVLSHHWGPINVIAAMILAWSTPSAQSCNTDINQITMR